MNCKMFIMLICFPSLFINGVKRDIVAGYIEKALKIYIYPFNEMIMYWVMDNWTKIVNGNKLQQYQFQKWELGIDFLKIL